MLGAIRTLIGRRTAADKGHMRRDDRDAYQAWLVGELLLVGLLGAALALFLAYPSLRNTYELPSLRLALDTGIMLAATVVAVLAGIRSPSKDGVSTCSSAQASRPRRRRASASALRRYSAAIRSGRRRRGRPWAAVSSPSR